MVLTLFHKKWIIDENIYKMFSSPQTMLYGEQPGYISGVAIALHKKMKFSIKDFFSKRD